MPQYCCYTDLLFEKEYNCSRGLLSNRLLCQRGRMVREAWPSDKLAGKNPNETTRGGITGVPGEWHTLVHSFQHVSEEVAAGGRTGREWIRPRIHLNGAAAWKLQVMRKTAGGMWGEGEREGESGDKEKERWREQGGGVAVHSAPCWSSWGSAAALKT